MLPHELSQGALLRHYLGERGFHPEVKLDPSYVVFRGELSASPGVRRMAYFYFEKDASGEVIPNVRDIVIVEQIHVAPGDVTQEKNPEIYAAIAPYIADGRTSPDQRVCVRCGIRSREYIETPEGLLCRVCAV